MTIQKFPADWSVKSLAAIPCEVIDCHHSTPVWTSSGHLVIRNQNIRNGKLDLAEQSYTDARHFQERIRRAKPTAGDIVITREAPMGQVCMIPKDLQCRLGQRMVLLRITSAGAHGNYVLYALQSEAMQKYIAVTGGTGSTVSNLRIPVIKALSIPLPSDSEQRAIVTALSDIDALIAGLEKMIAKKRDLKQAAMQQLLTGQTRLPGFSGAWSVKRLGDHFSILKNGVNSRAELSVEGGVAYLHYGDIHGSKSLFLNPQKTTMPTLPLAKAKDLDRLQSGDLVFADASEDLDGVGKSVEVQGSDVLDLVSGQHTIAIRFDKTVLADGFKAYLQFFPAFSAHLYKLAAGTKVYATNRSHIGSAEIKLPEVDEQRAIASILHSMDAELSSIENRLAKVRQLKQGMMQELLTGRTRLI
jgi:type I restriction enzyme, S subunit